MTVERAAAEFSGSSLGDERLDARLQKVVQRLAVKPEASFPQQMASEAEQEALYRFLANPRVTLAKLLAAHTEHSIERLGAHSVVRIVHDTTELRFSGDREGLGILHEGAKGMFAHVTLAVGGDDAREPLGVLNVHTWVHPQQTKFRRNETASEKTARGRRTPRSEKRSHRWEDAALAVEKHIPRQVRAIHVMDREANDFDVFKALAEAGARFVIRTNVARVDSDENERLTHVLARKPATAFRTVPLTARPMTRSVRRNPVRTEREAKLDIRWGETKVARKQTEYVTGGELTLWAVHVFEAAPPEGEEPIEWILLTTERVEDLAAATGVVDHYRARWMIEEYFKALKTGCAIEKRQLCSREALERALGLFLPMAWQLLRLRHLARAEPERSATEVLGPPQLVLLRLLLEDRRRALPEKPTVRDVMLGIAALGGHIKNNGDPGWLVLGRGLETFLEADQVRMLLAKSDQS